MNKNEALVQLKGLVERFGANIQQYTSNQYDEANTRVDFIDKFFELLGRDVSNNQGFSENYREVVREDKVKVSGNMKAPDYSFRLGGKRIFFVEAKKPSVDLKSAIGPAFQVRRYSWTAKLPLGILTDFEEIAVYDTRVKPDHEDKADNARIFYCKFDEYEKNRDFIYDTFSKEAVQKGSFDRYITEGKKKGTSEVDKEFFKLITSRREDLAKNIYLRNKKIFETDIESLGFVVQNIIDKIIFLRIAEDREIEEYGKLQGQLKLEKIDASIYHQLIGYFLYANEKYDSSLFEVSSLLKEIKIDDKILKDIINSLYYPESPYAFSVLGVDILGNIYEQFLGRDIVQKNGTIYIEEKPEVKKAGGVYYTPKYIVEYIVKNTVGELLKKSKITEALKIKIVDPACGSGSFLIGAYTHLLDWYLEQYSKDDTIKKSIQGNKIFKYGQYYHLTLPAKIEILKNNIHGVDIDEKAVEVTKLSLLLKLMEGETRETSRMLISGRDAKILPNLEDNIKCGNSLIGADYRDNQKEVPNPEEIKKMHAFDWEKQFEKVFNQGGFDIVIGNPPYIKERDSKDLFRPLSKYSPYYQGKMDFRYLFLHKAIDIAQKKGLIGFITNSYRTKSDGSSKLIDRIQKELTFDKIVDFGALPVFVGVSGKHMVHIYRRQMATNKDKSLYLEISKEDNQTGNIDNKKGEYLNAIDIIKNGKIYFGDNGDILGGKNVIELGNIYDVSQGVVEASDKISRKALETHGGEHEVGDGIFVLSKDELSGLGLSAEEKFCIKKYLDSNDIGKYYIDFDKQYLIYSGREEIKKISKGEYPNIQKHLKGLQKFITSSNKPYGLHRPREQKFFDSPKLICKGMFKTPEFCYDDQNYYVGMSFSVIIQKDPNYDLKFLLGCMNSKLGNYRFQQNGKKRGIGVDIGVLVFREFPVPKVEPEKQMNLISLVEQMLVAQKTLHQTISDNDKKTYQQQVEIIDNKIDNLVFDLYGLSEEERRVVLAG